MIYRYTQTSRKTQKLTIQHLYVEYNKFRDHYAYWPCRIEMNIDSYTVILKDTDFTNLSTVTKVKPPTILGMEIVIDNDIEFGKFKVVYELTTL